MEPAFQLAIGATAVFTAAIIGILLSSEDRWTDEDELDWRENNPHSESR
jgi:hypothetical protein